MKTPDSRRKRRIILLFSAILIPAAIVILLVFRVVRQETELSVRRSVQEQRDALDQLRRELSARLQAIRVEEVNRLIGESGFRLPPDSPIVFVAPLETDRMILPWEAEPAIPTSSTAHSAELAQFRAEGESLEFRAGNAAAAASAYQRALQLANTPLEKCEASLWLGRAYSKAGASGNADRVDRGMLQECDDIADIDGIPFSLYAVQRILTAKQNDDAAVNYVIRKAGSPPGNRQWRPPSEAYMLKSLLTAIPGDTAKESLRKLSSDIQLMERINAFAENIPDHLGKLQHAFRSAPGDLSWEGYGDEPWLVTMVSPESFATPVVIVVSSKKVVPDGIRLQVQSSAGAIPLGEGFVDVHASWPANRFSAPHGVPTILYVSGLLLILGAAFGAVYLLLRDMHREVETAEMRSQFVASVSHELNTPLTAIRAVAETLLLGRADGEQSTPEYLKTIISESERLSRLVKNVLDFSRIEQGRKIYRMQPTGLGDVVHSAAKAMEYPLSQLGFTLTISTDDSAPILNGDADALKQALLNLIGNAMKYSGSARRIEMHLGRRDNEAFVDVVDHGIGISREDQARIFEKFHRVRSSETEGIAGTGLGLALTLHIVEAHRGHIEVSSDVGRGSTFSVRIPLQEQV